MHPAQAHESWVVVGLFSLQIHSGAFTLSRTPTTTTTTTIAAEVLGLARKSRICSGTFYRKWQIERSLKSVWRCWWSLPTTHQGWSIRLGNPRACHMSPLLKWFRSSYLPVSFSMILSLVGQLKLMIQMNSLDPPQALPPPQKTKVPKYSDIRIISLPKYAHMYVQRYSIILLCIVE